MPWSSRALGRFLSLLMIPSWTVSCGRVGYDLLGIMTDRGSTDAAPDVVPTDGRGPAEDATPRDAPPIPSDAPLAEGAPDDGPALPVRDAAPDRVDGPVDAPVPDGPARDGSVDATDAASSEGGSDSSTPPCSVTREWSLEFDSDPTAYDGDGDGTLDWLVRGGGAFPTAELGQGIWASTGPVALDSRPRDPFGTRVVADVRMRSLAPGATRGAVFWINLNQGGAQFSVLFANVVLLLGGGQELQIIGKVGAIETLIATIGGLPESFVDVHLDVDPVALTVAVRVGGVDSGTFAVPVTGPPNADDFATLISWSGTSEFDVVRIVRCAP